MFMGKISKISFLSDVSTLSDYGRIRKLKISFKKKANNFSVCIFFM